jgi:hypothetical protein
MYAPEMFVVWAMCISAWVGPGDPRVIHKMKLLLGNLETVVQTCDSISEFLLELIFFSHTKTRKGFQVSLSTDNGIEVQMSSIIQFKQKKFKKKERKLPANW